MSEPVATVVIPTKNRRNELRAAIVSSLAQSVPVKVIVMDDDSTDGTEQMMRDEFPTVHYERLSGLNGPCVLRNRGIRAASTDIVVSIDDDSQFPSPRTIEQTLKEFDHPQIGAIAIPFININQNNSPPLPLPSPRGIYLTDAYVGASHAVVRELFLRLGGYRESMLYMGEEGEYCIRMLDAGYFVCAGRADPIHHLESPRRVRKRAVESTARNLILFAWWNVPMPYCALHLPMTMINVLRYAMHQQPMLRTVLWTFSGIGRGWARMIRHPGERHPVQTATYRLSRRLKHRGPLLLESMAVQNASGRN